MLDTLRGPVFRVVDGDTFDIRVTHVGNQNKYKYGSEERVRIADIDEPELRTPLGQRSRSILQDRLEGKEVRCYVHTRDSYNRIVADVMVLQD